jgi:hypothetical protein
MQMKIQLRGHIVRILVAATLASLAGCSSRPNPNICSTPTPVDVSGASIGSWSGVESCLHRWGYRLAGSPEPAPVVAEAVVGGCYDAIEKWAFKIAGTDDQLPPYREPVTGRVMDYRANLFQQARSYAQFYVVQSRAGHCRVP